MFTLRDILDGNDGSLRLQGSAPVDPGQVFPAAQHDSRQIGEGDLFIAIPGAHVDGHRFIGAAQRARAGAVLCSEAAADVAADFLQIVVPDVIMALHATARVRARRQQQTTLIGITGSNGKTSTKDAVAHVLGRQFSTLKTYASYNNELGYPLSLLRLEEGQRFAVLEMGAQWVGELQWLCETIATPNWSIITNVGAAHLGLFGSQERVSMAKSELVRALAPGGIAILNYDNAYVRAMRDVTRARVLFYGSEEGAEVHGGEIGGDTLFGRSFSLSYHGEEARVQLRLPGEHGVSIALAAAAAGCAAGMSLDVIRGALQELTPAQGRGEIKRGPHGSILIDDTYNANRQSIVAITRAMHDARIAPGGKRWAVLGDIFELGQYARAEHCASGEALPATVDYLVAIGDEARYYVEGAMRARMPADQVFYFDADVASAAAVEEAKRAAAELLKQRVRGGDMVLLKGSRAMRFETMLELLREDLM
jgi:UDP-N-acetylmuramoyl-tripeptide--D-alanyl-D-alanine ligase